VEGKLKKVTKYLKFNPSELVEEGYNFGQDTSLKSGKIYTTEVDITSVSSNSIPYVHQYGVFGFALVFYH